MRDWVNIDESLIAIGKKLEKNPDDWEAWAAKADILFYMELFGFTIRCCDRSLALNPDNHLTWITKGKALEKMGKHEEAKAAFTKAEKLKSP